MRPVTLAVGGGFSIPILMAVAGRAFPLNIVTVPSPPMNKFGVCCVTRSRILWTVPLLSLAVAFLIGCGDSGPEGPTRVKTVPVIGKVTVDGSPVELPKQIRIRAYLVGGESPTGTEPGATVNLDGTFALSTYEAGDGIPVGEYKLTFQLGRQNMMRARFEGDDFNGKYIDPDKSEHKVTVGENDTEPIDLGTIELTTQ